MGPQNEPLEAFTAAWQRCRTDKALPTLEALRQAGAPLDNPGFALLGCTKRAETKRPAFTFIAAGEDHERLGGKALQGRWLDQLVHPAHLKSIVELYQSICAQGTLHRWRCMNMVRNAPPKSYTRVLAAIQDDVGDGRCLAGVWVWHENGADNPTPT